MPNESTPSQAGKSKTPRPQTKTPRRPDAVSAFRNRIEGRSESTAPETTPSPTRETKRPRPQTGVPKRVRPIAGRYARDASIIVRTVACSSVRFSSEGIHCCVTTGTGSWNFAFSSSAYTCLGPSGAQP